MMSLCGNYLQSATMIAALIALTGCGGDPGAERPDRTPVSGSVSFAGSPVSGATVTFSPATEGTGRAATGITDDAGNFVLGTFERADGAVAGDYKVLISKIEQPASDPANQVSEDDPAYDGGPTGDESEAEVDSAPRSLIPAVFGKRATTTLTATVGTDPVEGLKFDLGG